MMLWEDFETRLNDLYSEIEWYEDQIDYAENCRAEVEREIDDLRREYYGQ